jgi:twitching motility protein PilT
VRLLLRDPNLARFRVNAFNQQRGAGAVFRTIPSKVLTLEELKLPEDLQGDFR